MILHGESGPPVPPPLDPHMVAMAVCTKLPNNAYEGVMDLNGVGIHARIQKDLPEGVQL